MSDRISTPAVAAKPNLLSLGIAHFFEVALIFCLMGGVLFLAAGRLDWLDAWVLLGVYFLITLGASLWMLHADPQLLKERDQAVMKTNVKRWDRLLILANLMLALFAVIGWDAGRLRVSTVPGAIRLLAGAAVLASFGITLWASRVNTFMSAMVRIQEDRGHRTVTIGPYRLIRHPMYLVMVVLDIALPLVFNSWMGLAVSAAMIAAVVLRTAMEDATLQKELPGYAEYVRQVRYRLVPGIW